MYKILSKERMENSFPNVFNLICLCLVFALSSNSSERSFSPLRLIKSYLRSTMKQDRLSALAIIRLNKDIIIDVEKILDDFGKAKKRRLDLLFLD